MAPRCLCCVLQSVAVVLVTQPVHLVQGIACAGSRRDFANSATAAFQRGVILSSCESDLLTRVCVDVTVGLALVYFAVTCALILMKLSMHKKFSYRMIQMGSVFFRLQVSCTRSEQNLPAMQSSPDTIIL